jgi:hypothetical protein
MASGAASTADRQLECRRGDCISCRPPPPRDIGVSHEQSGACMHLIVAASIGYLDHEYNSAFVLKQNSDPLIFIFICHIIIAMKTIPAKAFQGASHASLELDVATRMLGAFHIIQAHVTTDTDLINDAYQTVFSEPRFLTACCHVLGAFAIFRSSYPSTFCAIIVALTPLFRSFRLFSLELKSCSIFNIVDLVFMQARTPRATMRSMLPKRCTKAPILRRLRPIWPRASPTLMHSSACWVPCPVPCTTTPPCCT